jgi:hypothetical protein
MGVLGAVGAGCGWEGRVCVVRLQSTDDESHLSGCVVPIFGGLVFGEGSGEALRDEDTERE